MVVNGSFESGYTGWTETGNQEIRTVTNDPFPLTATDGTHMCSFNEGQTTPNGVLSQTVATTPGTSYTLAFDVAVSGYQTNLQQRMQVTVQDGSISLSSKTITLTGQGTGTWWTPQSLTFTATGSSATLTFYDTSLDTINTDLLLDNVRITVNGSPTPTPTPAATPVPLGNADFELGPFDSPGTITGWTVAGGGHIADRIQEGSSNGSGAAVFSPGGDFQGDTLSQTFTTTPGQTYTLDFDSGIFGVPDSGATLQVHVQVFGSSTLLDALIIPPKNTGSTPFDPSQVPFAHYHYTFTATGSSTTLQFTDVGSGNANADQILDHIAIAPSP